MPMNRQLAGQVGVFGREERSEQHHEEESEDDQTTHNQRRVPLHVIATARLPDLTLLVG